MAFYGEQRVNFSGTGRIVLPKRIRDAITGNQIIVAKGKGQCLHGYAIVDFEKRAKELLEVSLLEHEMLDKRRFLFSSATQLELDSQGRIVLPKVLLEYAKLENELVIIGAGDHFECWNSSVWDAYLKNIVI